MESHSRHRSSVGPLLLALSFGVFTAQAADAQPFPADETVASPALEMALALELRDAFESEAVLADDPELFERVRRVGRRVAENSDRPDLPYTFYVLDRSGRYGDYQAISLPGGTVALTRELAELLAEEEDLLAFALAHEIAHVALRHHLSGANLRQERNHGAADLAEQLQRYREFEADRYGALYLVRAGFRFTAAAEALERLEEAAPVPKRDLGGHPGYERRLESLERFLPELERSVAAFDRGGDLLRAGNVDDALAALGIFVQQFPRSVAGRVDLGVACLVQLGQRSGTPGGLEEPLPFIVESGIEVRGMFDGELLERARRNFQLALTVQPSNPEALLGLALVELHEADTAASLRYLERAGEISEDPRLLLARGNARFLAGRPDQATHDYLQALDLEHDWPAARKNLALAYESIDRSDRAEALWRDLIDEPGYSELARWRLTLLARRER